jgi:sarcosine oxidase subunit alpha
MVTPEGPLGRARNLLVGPRRTLGHRFDDRSGLNGPWLDAAPVATLTCDLAVVGGGVAGMSAAIAGVIAKQKVILIEQDQRVGGIVGFFGRSEGEEQPEALVHSLNVELAQVEILTGSRVLSLDGTRLRVRRPGGIAIVEAKRVVIATGARQRLPVFPGNRSPGVATALAAWRRAERYGVWLGHKALVSTVANQAYRLAVAAAESGIAIQRVVDTRPLPASRHIDYAKASGIPMTIGLAPRGVEPARQNLSGLYATFAGPYEGSERTVDPIWTAQLIVCGTWQPDLALWHMAGGHSRWSNETARLEPVGELESIALAGSAVGWRSTHACLASGRAAVLKLLGRKYEPVDDPRIDPAFDTPDAATPVTPWRTGYPAFLDSGTGLAALPAQRRLGRWRLPAAAPRLEDHGYALTTGEVAAAVQLGLIPPDDAPAVARERSNPPTMIASAESSPQPLSRAWLDGRFGPSPATWIAASGDTRSFEVGSLVYASAEPATPLSAVGVVLAAAGPGQARIMIGKSPIAAGDTVVVRDAGGAIKVKLVEAASA